MKVKIKILICTGLMLNDHSNPYIESTTVLSDTHNYTIIYTHDVFLVSFVSYLTPETVL